MKTQIKTRRKLVVTKDMARKIVANPRTPPQLKAYWKKRFKLK